MDRYSVVIALGLWTMLLACKPKRSNSLPSDPCLRIEQTLIGNFNTALMEGSMNFSGGLSGSVDISGRDYNDITCTYRITDCARDTLNMNCNGALYNAGFQILSRDTIRIDHLTYIREK